jgi:hypothetical protein
LHFQTRVPSTAHNQVARALFRQFGLDVRYRRIRSDVSETDISWMDPARLT